MKDGVWDVDPNAVSPNLIYGWGLLAGSFYCPKIGVFHLIGESDSISASSIAGIIFDID